MAAPNPAAWTAGGAGSEEKTFFESGAHNSFPTLLEHAPGEYYCVWDSGAADRHRTHIRFGKPKLAAETK